MSAALSAKRILVLCDNQKLSKALQLNLQAHWQVSQTTLPASRQPSRRIDEFSLIILALSSPASEPVVALTRAALIKYIGRIPLLIISDRPFPSSPQERITHLDFPFNPQSLYTRVQEILRAQPEAATAAR